MEILHQEQCIFCAITNYLHITTDVDFCHFKLNRKRVVGSWQSSLVSISVTVMIKPGSCKVGVSHNQPIKTNPRRWKLHIAELLDGSSSPFRTNWALIDWLQNMPTLQNPVFDQDQNCDWHQTWLKRIENYFSIKQNYRCPHWSWDVEIIHDCEADALFLSWIFII